MRAAQEEQRKALEPVRSSESKNDCKQSSNVQAPDRRDTREGAIAGCGGEDGMGEGVSTSSHRRDDGLFVRFHGRGVEGELFHAVDEPLHRVRGLRVVLSSGG